MPPLHFTFSGVELSGVHFCLFESCEEGSSCFVARISFLLVFGVIPVNRVNAIPSFGLLPSKKLFE